MSIVWWTSGPITSAMVYYSIVDIKDEQVSVDSLACNHDMTKKGFLGRNTTFGKFVHKVVLTGLLPNRRYCYEITSGHASSHIYTFRTADLSINLGIKNEQSDLNFENSHFILNSNYLLQSKQNESNEFIIEENKESLSFLIEGMKYHLIKKKINGFINLSPIQLSQFNLFSLVNNFNQLISYEKDFLDYFDDLLTSMQIIPALGSLDEKQNSLFNSMFPLISTIEKQEQVFYSRDANGVHFVSFIFESKYSREFLNTQISILEKDLAKANQNRNLVPWVVIILSKQISCSNLHCNGTRFDTLVRK